MNRRFLVMDEYPFMKYKIGDIIFPSDEESKEMEKYPSIFEDITKNFEVLEYDGENIIKVKRLSDDAIFSIGDWVVYKLGWILTPLKFRIDEMCVDGEHGDILDLYYKDVLICTSNILIKDPTEEDLNNAKEVIKYN